MNPIKRYRRLRAEIALALVDAEVARWYVNDGQLSDRPLGRAQLSGIGVELRVQRLEAVAELERFGGRDPWPTVLLEPTEAQRFGWGSRAIPVGDEARA